MVLPHNSASGYARSGTLSERELCGDTCGWEQRGGLAVAGRGAAASTVTPAEWPALLAAEDPSSTIEADLIEVVLRDGRRPLPTIESVRIVEADYDALLARYLRTVGASAPGPMQADAETAGRVADAFDNDVLALELL